MIKHEIHRITESGSPSCPMRIYLKKNASYILMNLFRARWSRNCKSTRRRRRPLCSQNSDDSGHNVDTSERMEVRE